MANAYIDQSYVREILERCSAVTKNTFYQGCQIDINAGYRAEVDEAWRIRSNHRNAVVASLDKKILNERSAAMRAALSSED